MKSSWQTGLDSLIQAGTAKSTQRAHDRDIRYFCEWLKISCDAVLSYPVALEHIIGFIVEHSVSMPSHVQSTLISRGLKKKVGPLSPRTIRRMIGSLSAMHNERGVTNPCAHNQVRLLLKKLTVASIYQSRKKVAITAPILDALLITCGETLSDIRDRALLQFAVTTGGRRRSELTQICIENLEPIQGGYLVSIGQSKSDQEGEGQQVPLLGKAAIDVKAWLVASGIRKGKLFRGIHRSGKLRGGISGDTINRIVKHRATLAGFDEKEFSAHCLRSGFITESGRQGIHVKDAMALSGHTDIVVAQGYYKDAELLANPASHVFEKD